ncbi:CDT1-like protein b, partial [Cucurbita argyrosperma subsp. sororia]
MTQTPEQLTPKKSMLPSSYVKTRKPANVGRLCKAAKRVHDLSAMEGDNGALRLGVAEKKASVDVKNVVRVVYNIFKSVNCASINKEELVHEIMMSSLDINERSEVEEQIEQLHELVPNWISKNLTPSGDVTFSIDPMEDLESVVARTACI